MARSAPDWHWRRRARRAAQSDQRERNKAVVRRFKDLQGTKDEEKC